MDYSKNRNDPILEGTSRISPYLALGIISPRSVFLKLLKLIILNLLLEILVLLNGLMRLSGESFIKILCFLFQKLAEVSHFKITQKN